MKKMYAKTFMKRFVIYPAVIGYLTLHLFDWMVVSEFGKMFLDSGPLAIIEKTFGLSLPFEKMKLFYAYAIGFSYGTMSVVLPIHKLGLGVIGLFMMYLKYVLTVFVVAPLAMAWLPVELLIAGTVFVFSKNGKKSIKRKKESKRMNRQQPIHV